MVAASAVATVAMGLRSNGAATVTSGELLFAPGTFKAYRSVAIAAPCMWESVDSSSRAAAPQPR